MWTVPQCQWCAQKLILELIALIIIMLNALGIELIRFVYCQHTVLLSLQMSATDESTEQLVKKNRVALRTHELLRLTKTMAPTLFWDVLLPAETWRLAKPMRPLKTKRICTPGPMASMSKLCKVERSTRERTSGTGTVRWMSRMTPHQQSNSGSGLNHKHRNKPWLSTC